MARIEARLSDLMSLRPQFLRSVHLERDFYTQDITDGYLLTRGSLSALSLLARGTKDPSYRAQSISGPYGSGKSALAMYFGRLLNKNGTFPSGLRTKARSQLGNIGAGLLPPNAEGYVIVLATGTREGLAACLMSSLRLSLQKSGGTDLLKRLFGGGTQANVYSSREVVGIFEKLSRLAVDQGSLGVVVIIDELGKLLEHAALYPGENDLGLLQEMAEAAARSIDYPLWLVTILHQDLSHYASRLGRRHQREWFKVQQRFYDVPCLLDDTDALQLVAEALKASANRTVGRNSIVRKVAKTCAKIGPKGAEQDFKAWCVSSYPLHPTSLVLLPVLFRRFGQNERSLFSFLSANEPFALQDWVKGQEFYEHTRLSCVSPKSLTMPPTISLATGWTSILLALGQR